MSFIHSETAGASSGSMSPDDAGDVRMRLVHAAMRGRYRRAFTVALLIGIPAAVAGFMGGAETYRSVVPIRIVPVVPRVLYTDEEKGIMPRYESFVETQVSLIRSQRVIDLAMQDPKWALIDKDRSNDAVLSFTNALTVARKNEMISVQFNDQDSTRAMAGAQAVVNAYKKLFLEEDAVSETRRLEILQQLQTALTNDLESKKQRLASIAGDYEVNDIARLRDAKFNEVQKLNGTLAELELQLELMNSVKADPETDLASTTFEWAARDQELADLLRKKRQATLEVGSMRSLGFGPDHRRVLNAEVEIDQLEIAIAERVQELQSAPPRLITTTAGVGVLGTPEMTKARADRVREMIEKAKTEYQTLTKSEVQAAELREQMDGISKKLDDTRRRIEQLNIESSISGRISVLSDAERPLAPFSDTRRKYAIFGGFGGLIVGFGSVLAFALADRRVRSVEEVRLRLSVDNVLGVLPSLPTDPSDQSKAALASHAVHHIRSMLQIRVKVDKPTLVVTSPLSGTGKTSLTLALGVSYASTGSRVLVIDCDVIGGGMTRRVNSIARRRIGQLLSRKGVITSAQLQEALTTARRTKRKIGEVVVELGFANKSQVDACLSEQGDSSIGLVEAMAGEHLGHCVATTGVANLWILPLGEATAHDAGSLSPAALSKLIAGAKKHFDVVLVDTGPVPGSLEASIVAAAVDGVVLLLSRGEPRQVAEACLTQLRAVGAKLVGVVFNRVRPDEMPIYTTSSPNRSTRPTSLPAARQREAVLSKIDNGSDFGPMARAVVSSAPGGESR